jgi:hypothetical protein
MAITVPQIIQDVSTQLNDQEPGFTFTRWTQLELLTYLNEALIEVANYRPDAYIATGLITLVAGSQQLLGVDVSFLVSLNSSGSGALCPDAPITQVDLNLMRTFYKKPCLPTGGAEEYRVRSWAYDAKNPLVFYVSPPVPAGNTTKVVMTVIAKASQFTSADLGGSPLDIDQKYYNALKYWMMARAYEVDTESSTSQAESERYRKQFYGALGVQYKQNSDFSSGKYMGQGGDNQMTKQRIA